MKKFMSLMVLFFALTQLTGCANVSGSSRLDNPYAHNALVFLGTVGGAVAARNTFHTPLAAVGGAIAGNLITNAALYKPRDNNVQYVYAQGGGAQYQQYPQAVGYNSYSGAMCHDERSGGQISCQFLARNPRYECCGIIERNDAYQRPVQQQAVYTTGQQQQMTYSQPLTQPQPQQVAEVKKPSRLTVDNYRDEGAVINEPGWEGCRSKNWAVASACLKRWSLRLKDLQAKCIANESKPVVEHNPECESNPGVLSREASELADDLDRKQEEEGGKIILK